MRSQRRSLAIAVLLLAPVLTGCGGGDDEPDDSPPSSSSPDLPDASTGSTSEATSGTTPDAPAGLPAACDVLTSADVAAAFGVPFGEPTLGSGGTAEQDLEWRSDNCNFEAADLVEVDLALTGPDDFTVGGFQCPEPTSIASTVTPAEVPGALDAWWEIDDSPPLEASLRVCTEGYNFDIDLEYEDGVDFEGDPQQQSIALAGVVLAKIDG